MDARRRTITEKFLRIIDAACGDVIDEVGAMLSYSELRKRLRRSGYKEGSLSDTIYHLRQSGYLEVVEKDAIKSVRITKKGRFKIWKPKVDNSWDGRWRLIGYDVTEIRRKTRDDLRLALKKLGFVQMQQSLWLCPYDVSEEIEEVLDMLDLREEVDYFIAEAITNKEKYLDMFDLNQ